MYTHDLHPHEALLNITYKGQNGELPMPVPYDALDIDLRNWAAEAIGGGDVPGIRRERRANFKDYVVDRFPAGPQRRHNVIFLRPSTPFG